MVSDKVFTADGTSKIYSIDFNIISDNHCNVYIDNVLQSRTIYDIINNAIVFEDAPTANASLIIQVGTTPDDLLTNPTDAGIVASNITDVNTVADNITDLQFVANNMAEVLLADDNAAAAAASAAAAALSEAATALDAAATAADLILTNADVVATNADVAQTALDVIATAADVVTTNTNVATTNADVLLTNADAVATAADRVQTGLDVITTAADRAQTALDVISTNADVVSTNADVVTTNANVLLTNADAIATAADRVQTGLDVIAAAASASAAAASAVSAQASLDAIEGSYLGVQASDPTLDLNGDAITIGDWYYNSTSNITRIYDGTVWQNGAVSTSDFVSKLGDTMTGVLIAPTFEGNFDGAFTDLSKNVSGGTLLKGTPVYQSGTAGNAMEVQMSDASNAATMPAVGVLAQDLDDDEEGDIIHFGNIQGVDTSSFNEGDVIYVAVGGGFTNVQPTGEGNLLQNLGRVKKVHDSNGGGFVMGAGRANATPNLNDGNIFIGNASNQAVSVALSTVALSPTGDGSQLTGIDALPSQATHAGKYLGTDGTTASWNTLDTDANSTTKGLYEHANTIAANYTIATGNNALTAGPITINTGVSVSIPTGSTWVIA